LAKTDRYIEGLLDIPLLEKLTSRSFEETVAVKASDSILKVLLLMKKKAVSAVAVIHPVTENIVGNFSASDLLKLKSCDLSDLCMQVKTFLEIYSPTSTVPQTIESQGTTLGETIKLFSQLGIHRLWMIDSSTGSSVPVGVVTLTDIMHTLSIL